MTLTATPPVTDLMARLPRELVLSVTYLYEQGTHLLLVHNSPDPDRHKRPPWRGWQLPALRPTLKQCLEHLASGGLVGLLPDSIGLLVVLELLTRQHGVEVVRLALNHDQVAEYQPPPNSAKLTDSRSPPYVAMYGLESWELDALVSAAIEQFLDQDLYDEMLEREEPDQAAIRAAAKSLSSGDGR